MLKQHTFDHLAVSVVNPRHGLPGLSVSGARQVHPVMGAGAYSHQTRLGIIFSSLRVADLLHLLRVLQHPFGAAAPLSSSRPLCAMWTSPVSICCTAAYSVKPGRERLASASAGETGVLPGMMSRHPGCILLVEACCRPCP